MIKVIDSGPGIANAPSQEGFGLGLSLVYDICHRYGWHFELTSHATVGTTAVFTWSELKTDEIATQ